MTLVTKFGLVLFITAVFGCSSATPHLTPAEVSEPETWGAAANVTQIRHLYFAEQPDEETLAVAQQRDIKVVINLRDPSEYDWDEERVARGLGLEYYNVPIAKNGPFSADAIQRIDALVAAHGDDKILLHCSSGNRAAGWLATHLVSQHALPTNDALAIAREAGITKDAISTKVKRYVSEHLTEGDAGDSQ